MKFTGPIVFVDSLDTLKLVELDIEKLEMSLEPQVQGKPRNVFFC